MLHRARSAVPGATSARAAGRSPADRLADLLVPAGGWLPPQAELPAQAATEESAPWRAEGHSDDGPQGRWEEEPDGSQDDPEDDPAGALAAGADGRRERSWAPAGRHTPSGPARWWRLEPGRAAVGALLVVATLAALAAGGVVLRGRPQEVAAPVVESRTAVRSDVDAHHDGEGTAGGGGPPTVDATGVPLPRPSGAPTATHVVVAVAGKVRSPGLVRLPVGSRVDDAVRAAGGPVDPAAVGLLNLARVLVDGEQVLVGVQAPPGSVPVGAGPGAPSGGGARGGPLDLNAASASDLDGLPGIGPVLAQRIVDWRTENGRFASVDQLREVTGIGEAKYQELVAKVVV